MLGGRSQVCIFVRKILYLVKRLPSPSPVNFKKLYLQSHWDVCPKLKDLRLIPRSHKVDGKNGPLQVVLCPLHVCCRVSAHAWTWNKEIDTQINVISNVFKNLPSDCIHCFPCFCDKMPGNRDVGGRFISAHGYKWVIIHHGWWGTGTGMWHCGIISQEEKMMTGDGAGLQTISTCPQWPTWSRIHFPKFPQLFRTTRLLRTKRHTREPMEDILRSSHSIDLPQFQTGEFHQTHIKFNKNV